MSRFNTVTHSTPVNILEQRYRCFGHLANHPRHFIVEIFRETAVPIRPGNEFCQDTMFRTFNLLRPVTDKNRHTIQVWSSPRGFSFMLHIVSRAFFHTIRTMHLNLFMRSRMNIDPSLLVDLSVAMHRHNFLFQADNMHFVVLEIEDSFQYTKG